MSKDEAQEELDYLLQRIPLLAAFSREVACELAGRLSERKVRAGETIFREGDVGAELLIVRRGAVRIFVAGADGREEAVLAVLTDGEFFGELSLLDGGYRSASAVAETETILLCLGQDVFYESLQSDCQAIRHVIKVLCCRLRDTDVRLVAAAFRDVRERLANYLWTRADRDARPTPEGLCISTEITDADLAEAVGATTGRIRTELARLQRDLVIKRRGTELTVLKPHDLRDMALGGSEPAAITVPDWLLG